MRDFKILKETSYLILILSMLIQGTCFFRTYKDSEEILKSETVKEEEKFEDRITFIIAYSLNKEHLLISISSYKATHKQIIALIKEKYKDSKKIRLNDPDESEVVNACRRFSILCAPGAVVLVSTEFIFLPFRLISFPRERYETRVIDKGVSKIEEIKISDDIFLKTNYTQDKNQKLYEIKNGLVQIPINELILGEYKKPLIKLILFNTKTATNDYATFIDLTKEMEKDSELAKRLENNKVHR
jgi:hypothetical protein